MITATGLQPTLQEAVLPPVSENFLSGFFRNCDLRSVDSSPSDPRVLKYAAKLCLKQARLVAASIHNVVKREWNLCSVAKLGAQADPKEALEIVKSIKPIPFRPHLEALQALAPCLPQEIAEIFDQAYAITKNEVYPASYPCSLRDLSIAMASSNPKRALELFDEALAAENLLDDSNKAGFRQCAILMMAKSLLPVDAQQSEQLFEQAIRQESDLFGVVEIAQALAKSNSKQASALLNEAFFDSALLDDNTRRDLRLMIVETLASFNPEEAQNITLKIDDRQVKAKALNLIATHVASSNPELAMALFDQFLHIEAILQSEQNISDDDRHDWHDKYVQQMAVAIAPSNHHKALLLASSIKSLAIHAETLKRIAESLVEKNPSLAIEIFEEAIDTVLKDPAGRALLFQKGPTHLHIAKTVASLTLSDPERLDKLFEKVHAIAESLQNRSLKDVALRKFHHAKAIADAVKMPERAVTIISATPNEDRELAREEIAQALSLLSQRLVQMANKA